MSKATEARLLKLQQESKQRHGCNSRSDFERKQKAIKAIADRINKQLSNDTIQNDPY